MKKTETNTSRLQYSQPKSREIRVMAQGLMCQSPNDTNRDGNPDASGSDDSENW